MAKDFVYLVSWPGAPEGEATKIVAESRRQAAEAAFHYWATDNPVEAAALGPVTLAVRSECGIAPPVRFRVAMVTRAVAEEVAGG